NETQDAIEAGEHVLLREQREILFAVQRDQLALDALRHFGAGGALAEGDIDFAQAFAVEQLQAAIDGDVDDVVEIEAEHLALRLHHADDAKPVATDTHQLTEWIGIAEQLRAHLVTEHDIGALDTIVLRQESAERDAHAPGLRQFGAAADHHGIALATAGIDL